MKTNTIQTNTSPTPIEGQTQSTGANELEIPSERSEVAVDPQNTETINLDKKVPEMEVDIPRKWEVVKEQAMAERPSLKKENKDRRGREAITTANAAIIEIRNDINAPLTLTKFCMPLPQLSQSKLTQNQRKGKAEKEIHQHGKQTSRKKSQESRVIYPS